MWKGLTALAGVYFMFLIEHFLTLAKMYKDKKQKVRERRSSARYARPLADGGGGVLLCTDPEEVGPGPTGFREASGSGGEPEAERG